MTIMITILKKNVSQRRVPSFRRVLGVNGQNLKIVKDMEIMIEIMIEIFNVLERDHSTYLSMYLLVLRIN